MWVRRLREILERLVMRAVVLFRRAIEARSARPAHRGILSIPGLRRLEAALEPSPSHAFWIEQIADISSQDRELLGAAAIVVIRIGIADHRVSVHVAGDVADHV